MPDVQLITEDGSLDRRAVFRAAHKQAGIDYKHRPAVGVTYTDRLKQYLSAYYEHAKHQRWQYDVARGDYSTSENVSSNPAEWRS
jgi:hypothetical protein